MTERTIAQATWAGDYWGRYGAIARSRRQYWGARWYFSELPPYEHTQKKLQYVNVLYSALTSVIPSAKRGNPVALLRSGILVMRLRPLLAYYARLDMGGDEFAELTADSHEMLGGILVNFSRLPFFGKETHLHIGSQYALFALKQTRNDPSSWTAALAAITCARVAEHDRSWIDARNNLEFAERQADGVSDPNQRARIYRSCATLRAEIGDPAHAFSLIDRADLVPGIDPGVQEKNAEVRRRIEAL